MIPKSITFSENNQEIVKPILPGLPISVFFTSFREDTYNCVNWHWHEMFQYCLVTEGIVDFHLPNSTYHVKAGDGIFIIFSRSILSMEGQEFPPPIFVWIFLPLSSAQRNTAAAVSATYSLSCAPPILPSCFYLNGIPGKRNSLTLSGKSIRC